MKKINRRGFTLIELLAAIVILGIIVALSIPQISNLVDSNDEKKYETYEDAIETSAKLYTDAYTEDMFGSNESGCYDIPYDDLSNKKLVKDININDVTCAGGADKKTFVRVYKSGEHYNYKVSMYCTTKDGGTVQYENNIQSVDGICDGTQVDDEGPIITLTLESGKSLDGWMTGAGEKVNIVVHDEYGLLENIKLKYAWSTSSTQSGVAASEWKTKSFGNERYKVSVDFKTSVPENINDDLYLHVVPEMVRDANGNYTTESKLFGPFRLDNTDPTCEINLSTQPTGLNDWYVVKPTVTMVVNDEHGTIKNYGMTTKKNPSTSDYEKILSKVQGDTSSVTWSGFVVDEAGNKTTCKTSSFKVDTTKPTTPKGGSISLPGSTKEVELGKVKDSTDATSGFKEYRYYVKNDAIAPANSDSGFKTSHKFTRDCGKSYYAYAIAIDNAGNRSDVYTIGNKSDGVDEYSAWGTCTKSCGTGTQTRTNTCALVTTGFEQNCNTQTCCTQDTIIYKDGTTCAGACGTGTKNRLAYSSYDDSIRCESFDTASGGSSCDTGKACCTESTVKYKDGSSCVGVCGSGTYNKLAYSTYASDYSIRCESFDTASGGSSCDTGKTCCTSSTIKYKDGSKCYGTCGTGTKNRLAYSTYAQDYSIRCESFDEASGGSSCDTGKSCCTPSTTNGNWSSCSCSAGNCTKTRTVTTVTCSGNTATTSTKTESEACTAPSHTHTYNARGEIKNYLGYEWSCSCGRQHSYGYYIYCSYCGAKATKSPTLVCSISPYGPAQGWTVLPGK